jgi:hypothetical protein
MMSLQSINVSREKIANAWLIAAQELGIIVTAPYALETGMGQYAFIAHVHNFGGSKGTLLDEPNNFERLIEVTREQGYNFSCLWDCYETYERQLFIDTLNDWQWFGDVDKKPDWYTEKPWS